MDFTVYIDESGDTGIAKVRTENSTGSSPYFVLGAVVCQPTAEIHAKNSLAEFKSTIGKSSWKHATELGHPEKVLLSREMGRMTQRYFSVVSNKNTLAEYKDTIAANPHKFYNKCVKYLLENVCQYLGRHLKSDGTLRVVLEERNHDYDGMIRYLTKVKENPIYPQSKNLSVLNPYSIVTRKKGSEDMLEFADFVAHAVYQCTNRSQGNYGIPEPRYFSEMSSRFAGDKSGRALNVGLKCLHSVEQLQLEPEVQELFVNTRVCSPAN